MALSPDGRTLASSAKDGKGVRLWDVRTGEPLHEVPVSTGWQWSLVSVAFSPDGRTLAGAGSIGFHLWDAHTGETTQSLRRPEKWSR